MFPPISNHVEQAIARLMSQYADAQNLQGLIRSILGPVQTIEGVLADLNTLRMFSVATGQQLDNLGKIIGLARGPGDTDAIYRNKLYAEVKINTSQGQPEQAIQTFQLFTSATLVLLSEHFPAEITISSDVVFPTQDLVDQILDILDHVLPAGVRPDGIITFDPVMPFAYDGTLPGFGYGDVIDPLIGGMYATIQTKNGFFQYAGDDITGLGYGSSDDPLVGGWYSDI